MTLLKVIQKKFTSPLSALLLFVVATLSSFGIFFCIGNIEMMMHDEHNHAATPYESPCRDNVGFSECTMNLFDHIESWQTSLLTLIPSFSQLFSLLIFVGILSFTVTQLLSTTSLTPLRRFLFYSRDNPHISLFNSFTLLFSKGILHPKIFA